MAAEEEEEEEEEIDHDLVATPNASLTPYIEKRAVAEFLHQMKAPLALAQQYAARLSADLTQLPRLRSDIERLQVMLRRVRAVATEFGVYSSERPLHTRRLGASISPLQLLKIVNECAHDFGVIHGGDDRGVRYQIDQISFEKVAGKFVTGDEDLLASAIGNLVDNAFKYSYPRTTIRIYLAANRDNLVLNVANTGVRLLESERQQVFERGWRGNDARMLMAGTGIGLWLASEIAKSHGGALSAIPTNSANETIFQLILPTT